MTAPIAITSADLQAFLWIALSAGFLGGFAYAAFSDAYRALCHLADQRRRERDFFADLADADRV